MMFLNMSLTPFLDPAVSAGDELDTTLTKIQGPNFSTTGKNSKRVGAVGFGPSL